MHKLNLFLVSLITLSLTFGSSIWGARADDEVPKNCSEYLVVEISPKAAEFEILMNEFFLNSVPSSEQVKTASKLLRAYEAEVNAAYKKGLKLKALTIIEQNKSLVACDFYKEQYLDYGRALYQAQILGSATSKRSYAVVDSLKVMNDDLRDFSDVFLGTFPGMFQKFNNALPCYTKQCVGS